MIGRCESPHRERAVLGSSTMRLLRRALLALAAAVATAIPAEPSYFAQTVDHGAAGSGKFSQRFYENSTSFAGPGSPILVIMGGEGAVPPSTGFFYPWIIDVLAPAFGALVIEPEHRFFGESLPFGNASLTPRHLTLLTPQQGLADAIALIVDVRARHNCTPGGTPGYCPVYTFGGSYPGFLSAMMRLRYPAVVARLTAARTRASATQPCKRPQPALSFCGAGWRVRGVGADALLLTASRPVRLLQNCHQLRPPRL